MSNLQVTDVKPFSFEELFSRLRKVQLKGWPDIKVYEPANFEIVTLTPAEVRERLYTPQPKVYTERLDRLDELNDAFREQNMDDFWALTQCYDFETMRDGESAGLWSMIPPVVEVLEYSAQIDYSSFIKCDIAPLPEAGELRVPATFRVICDGDHRIYHAVKNNRPVTIVQISNILPGYPYYALPQKYFKKELPTRDHGELPENKQFDKIHILPKEDEKKLYRLFPTGGILSGEVRPDADASQAK